MYCLDRQRDMDSTVLKKNVSSFKYPIQKDRSGEFKIKPGSQINVCMTSDFFHEDADALRQDVWSMFKFRSDVIWNLLTKRAENIASRLPKDWNDGYENVRLGVTTENQRRADQRIPILLDLPAKHKYIICAPFIGPVDIKKYLQTGQIEQVLCGGENYDGARPCYYTWVYDLHNQCKDAGVEFNFYETGTCFVLPNGHKLFEPNRTKQSQNAFYLNAYSPPSHKPEFKLFYPGTNQPIVDPFAPSFDKPRCKDCANRHTCSGCSNCSKCLKKTP